MSFTVQIVCERVFGDHLARQLANEIVSFRSLTRAAALWLMSTHFGIHAWLILWSWTQGCQVSPLTSCGTGNIEATDRDSWEYRAVSVVSNLNLKTIIVGSVFRLGAFELLMLGQTQHLIRIR